MTRTTRQSNLLHLPRRNSSFIMGVLFLIVLNNHVNIDFIGYSF